VLHDHPSYFKIADNLYGINGGHSRPSRRLHQSSDVFEQDFYGLIIT
jgi:hypothetical protein